MSTMIEEASASESVDYFQLFSSAEVCRFMDIAPFAQLSDARTFLEFSDRQRADRKSFRYTVREGSVFVGTICVYSIFWHQSRASIGYAIAREHWRKGIMSRALPQIETILKTTYDINRLQATVLQDNAASKRLLERQGYDREGILSQYEKWEGKGFVDLEMYAKILGREDG